MLIMYDYSCLNAYTLSGNLAAVTKLIHCCPLLHTMVVSEANSSATRYLISQTGRKITVTGSYASLFVDLHAFPAQ